MNKQWTEETMKMQKGILMLNFHYADVAGMSIHFGYEKPLRLIFE